VESRVKVNWAMNRFKRTLSKLPFEIKNADNEEGGFSVAEVDKWTLTMKWKLALVKQAVMELLEDDRVHGEIREKLEKWASLVPFESLMALRNEIFRANERMAIYQFPYEQMQAIQQKCLQFKTWIDMVDNTVGKAADDVRKLKSRQKRGSKSKDHTYTYTMIDDSMDDSQKALILWRNHQAAPQAAMPREAKAGAKPLPMYHVHHAIYRRKLESAEVSKNGSNISVSQIGIPVDSKKQKLPPLVTPMYEHDVDPFELAVRGSPSRKASELSPLELPPPASPIELSKSWGGPSPPRNHHPSPSRLSLDSSQGVSRLPSRLSVLSPPYRTRNSPTSRHRQRSPQRAPRNLSTHTNQGNSMRPATMGSFDPAQLAMKVRCPVPWPFLPSSPLPLCRLPSCPPPSPPTSPHPRLPRFPTYTTHTAQFSTLAVPLAPSRTPQGQRQHISLSCEGNGKDTYIWCSSIQSDYLTGLSGASANQNILHDKRQLVSSGSM